MLLEPADWLLWNIRGTLLWAVIMKVKGVCRNADAIGVRHDKLVKTICQKAYEEVCGVYAHSQAYAKRRDVDFPQECAEVLYLQGRKPTNDEVHTYFTQQYRHLILTNNKTQQLYIKCRNQKDTFCIKFINNLLNDETRQDAEDFLFCQTFGKELSSKKSLRGSVEKDHTSFENEKKQQSPGERYNNYFLLKYVKEGCKDKVLSLLEELERFRVEGSRTDEKIDHYEFDLKKWQKKQIYAVFKNVRICLSIKKNELGQYLLDHTNLGIDLNDSKKSININTLLNQI